jgi:hypothetical protein
MDKHTHDLWKRIKNNMEKSGKTHNKMYERVCQMVWYGKIKNNDKN